MMRKFNKEISGVILAGGEGRRMGKQDKTMLKLGERSLIQHVYDRISPQVESCFISTNGDSRRFSAITNLVIQDQHQPPRGPLEGLLSAMSTLHELESSALWVLATPADCPFVPLDLASKLKESAESSGSIVSYASYKGKRHYLCSLWSMKARAEVQNYLSGDSYSVRGLLKQLDAKELDFKLQTQDPFLNINTPDDLRLAESLLHTKQ